MAAQTFNLESFAWEYDVFLSSRGDSTSKTFTDDLHLALREAKLHTFRGENELRTGGDLSPELRRAIGSSRISVVVLSKDYASSRACLDELLQIVECKEKGKRMVFPVFYDVDPSEVRRQSGNYGVAFAAHEERFGASGKVQSWRNALTTVGNLSGWDLGEFANRYESKFIDAIIKEVRLVVSRVPMFGPKHVVGLESRAEDVVRYMCGEPCNDVRMIGIYGMGGIGKTTLAKAVYNKLFGYFERSCFLEIRSEISNQNGMRFIQQELLSILLIKDIKVGSEAEGIMLIKLWLQSKKCLIVLDDLEHLDQFNALCGERDWFGAGSRVILTTREAHVLKKLKKDECYAIKVLNDEESLQLFSLHAFGEPKLPNVDYIECLDGIVAYCGGLPLCLEVLGSYLSNKSREEWVSALEKLKRIPRNDVQAKLRISYDGLPDNLTKALFLDLAFLSNGILKDTAISIFKAMGYIPIIQIRDLADKCLIHDSGSYISMHSLLREMGKEVVRLESSNPGERSRLCCPNDIHDVLIGHKGTEKIEVIVPNPTLENVRYNTEAFKNMENLRFLQIDNVHLEGNFKNIFKELKYLHWNGCPLKYIPSNCLFEKLAHLEMALSDIKEFQAPLKYFQCLEYLDLSACDNLTRTPDFSGAQNLRSLYFLRCSSLSKVHSSIGNMEKLIDLNFDACLKLKKFPDSLCQLRSLQKLSIPFCETLKEFPKKWGNLTSLQSLDLRETNIRDLPSNLSHMPKLESFFLDSCKKLEMLRELPLNIKKMSIRNCEKLEMLPNLSNFKDLLELDLTGCRKLREIKGLENLLSIQRMELHGVPLLHFSESFKVLIGSKNNFGPMFDYPSFRCSLMDNEIPSWIRCQEEGSSISFRWPLCNLESYTFGFLGFFVWLVFNPTIPTPPTITTTTPWSTNTPYPPPPPPPPFSLDVITIENDGLKISHEREFSLHLKEEDTSSIYFITRGEVIRECFPNINVGEDIKVTYTGIARRVVKKIGVIALYRDGDGFNQFVPITKVG